MSESTSFQFQQLRSDAARKAFYARLKAPAWWLGGTRRSATFGWVDVFEKSDGKCVYCSRDLAASTDALAESTEEHLVPRSLLEASGLTFDNEHNMAVCCAGCNGLKNDSLPPAVHPCWKSRKAFINECRRFIAECRLRNFRKYKTHVENVLKKKGGPMNGRSEQRRIVAKVEQLMALVDALETQLAAARATAANLLSALVAELASAHTDGASHPRPVQHPAKTFT